MNKEINVGIIGFGLSGRYFFAPYIKQHPNLKLTHFVTSQSQLVKERYPEVTVLNSVDELLNDASIDLIIVSSPNQTHFEYAKAALLNNKHVIVEKPFTSTPEEAEELITLAKSKQLTLAPFQNRRWDADFLTVKQLLDTEALGDLLEFESHFDRFRPSHNRVAWKNEVSCFGGVLYDLGPHLIDQALSIFGKPKHLFADIRTQRVGVDTEDYFEIHLFYPNFKAVLKAGVFIPENGPRFIIRGRKGSYIKKGLDPQEANLRNEMQPTNANIGKEDEALFGTLYIEENSEIVQKTYPTVDGNYSAFFANIYNAIIGLEDLIIKPEDALLTITIVNKAFESSRDKRVLEV